MYFSCEIWRVAIFPHLYACIIGLEICHFIQLLHSIVMRIMKNDVSYMHAAVAVMSYALNHVHSKPTPHIASILCDLILYAVHLAMGKMYVCAWWSAMIWSCTWHFSDHFMEWSGLFSWVSESMLHKQRPLRYTYQLLCSLPVWWNKLNTVPIELCKDLLIYIHSSLSPWELLNWCKVYMSSWDDATVQRDVFPFHWGLLLLDINPLTMDIGVIMTNSVKVKGYHRLGLQLS